ncbi:uncharacterized protein LOC144684059 [Cetorhinus maximus]
MVYTRLAQRPARRLHVAREVPNVAHGGSFHNVAECLTTSADPNLANKTMWVLILLICSLPASGALWAKNEIRGVVGRAITTECHYDVADQSDVKYWCHGKSRQCHVLATTNWQKGRMSITDNKSQGLFIVTMKDLCSGDTGWYSCGIEKAGYDPMFSVELQISYVSGALWAKETVTGVVGRAITIECHYDARRYKSHIKYWCHGWTHQCHVVASTNWRNGRISVTDNKSRPIFTVTMEDLHSGDTGWYSCGIEKTGYDPMFAVWLQISYEPVSVPVLRFSTPLNVSCSGGSVSVSCESVQGSLPIQYTWYEKTLSEDSNFSDTNKLDLHCQSFKQQHHQYYCTASNNQGKKSSDTVNVSKIKAAATCVYLTNVVSSVSGALWAKERVTGVVGRAITIECHYDAWWYKYHVKYWCHGWDRQCHVLATTNLQNGRISITDNKSTGIFTVTMQDLRSGDTGWYSCGIEKTALDPMFAVWLQISYEPVSVPVLRFSTPLNVSCSGGSVSVSCESVQGSLPIQYTWYEKTLSEDSNFSDTNKLDLHCQSFKQQHHQYYCTASNNQGKKSSDTVNVSKISETGISYSYVIQIGNIGPEYYCEVSTTVSPTTHLTSTNIISTINRSTPSDPENPESYIIWDVIRWVLFTLLVICAISGTWCTRKSKNKLDDVRDLTLTENIGVTDTPLESRADLQDAFAVVTDQLNVQQNGDETRAECLETSSALIFVNKTMWILILLICSLPGALWAKERVTGVVGRAITIECHYDARNYKSHIKYWCHGWTRQCHVVASTNWRNGRISVTDNKSRPIFTVTMEDLHSGDTGWYSCGIEKTGNDSMFAVWLQISYEPVSVPVLRFSSPPHVSCSGGSVSISCESVQGSLPIQYTWYEKTLSEGSKISVTNKLDLHCQSFKQQHHQYYCTASNNQGKKSSDTVNVSMINVTDISCSYVIQIGNIVSGALWAKERVTGVVGRAITIECHYDARSYESHIKHWCHGWTRQCHVLASTNWRNGRISVTDYKSTGIFIVTMEDLRSGDTGWYSCGIGKTGLDSMFAVKLQISYEPVSVPVLRFSTPPHVSCSGGSVSISCESVQGSLPIQYTWYEKTLSEDSKISDTNKLDLHCQSFTKQLHQYHCIASNNQGEKPSYTVNLSMINVTKKSCSYVIQIGNIGPEYFCEVSTTVSPTTHLTSTNIISTINRSTPSDPENPERYKQHSKSSERQDSP